MLLSPSELTKAPHPSAGTRVLVPTVWVELNELPVRHLLAGCQSIKPRGEASRMFGRSSVVDHSGPPPDCRRTYAQFFRSSHGVQSPRCSYRHYSNKQADARNKKQQIHHQPEALIGQPPEDPKTEPGPKKCRRNEHDGIKTQTRTKRNRGTHELDQQ